MRTRNFHLRQLWMEIQCIPVKKTVLLERFPRINTPGVFRCYMLHLWFCYYHVMYSSNLTNIIFMSMLRYMWFYIPYVTFCCLLKSNSSFTLRKTRYCCVILLFRILRFKWSYIKNDCIDWKGATTNSYKFKVYTELPHLFGGYSLLPKLRDKINSL